MGDIVLYETTGFPNPARIRAALTEKNGLGCVSFVEVDVMNLEHRTPEFYDKNPLGTVPVLKTAEGLFLSESTAITEYIDGTFSGPSLIGETPIQRALTQMMQRRAESMVLDAATSYFHHATPGLGETLETDPCPAWGEKQKKALYQGLIYFDGVLAKSPFVAGDVFSMADITLFYGLAFMDFCNLPIPDELTHLTAWRLKQKARPCFL